MTYFQNYVARGAGDPLLLNRTLDIFLRNGQFWKISTKPSSSLFEKRYLSDKQDKSAVDGNGQGRAYRLV